MVPITIRYYKNWIGNDELNNITSARKISIAGSFFVCRTS